MVSVELSLKFTATLASIPFILGMAGALYWFAKKRWRAKMPPTIEVLKISEKLAVPMMTPKQVAERIQKSEKTVQRMTRSGAIPPPLTLGRELRWEVDVIEDWIAKGCPKQPLNR
jgi:predicted DNA-binding transcriptional regulator AlpA